MNILEVKNLTVFPFNRSEPVLKNISFKVEKNTIHALLGPNGSGKSSLAYALMGIRRFKKVQGEIIFEGENISHLPTFKRARKGLTLTFQEPARFEGIKIIDYLLAGASQKSEEEAKEALQLVGLKPQDYLERFIDKNLSGGERKRVELASVVMSKPKLLILDEPDSGLDIIIYSEFYDLLESIRERIGASILLISHREEIAMIASKATLLWDGEIVKSGDFREVMREYCKLSGRRQICKNKIC